MTAVEQPDEPQLWRDVELDDDVIDQLRHLLFAQQQNSQTKSRAVP